MIQEPQTVLNVIDEIVLFEFRFVALCRFDIAPLVLGGRFDSFGTADNIAFALMQRSNR